MNRRSARLLIRFYPRCWRERYGEEFEALLMAGRGSTHELLDVARSALKEHASPARRSAEERCTLPFTFMLSRPSAVAPMVMSAAALGVVIAHIAMAGIARQADEGAAAHSWQLLMAAQVPVLLFFAVKWIPKAPARAFRVIALQTAAAVAAVAPVFFLGW